MTVTFRVDTTGAGSRIDHFAVSDVLVDSVLDYKVIDDGINLSDHCPVVLDICLPKIMKPAIKQEPKKSMKQLNFRWDKADVLVITT